jgi:hypothetical protein
VDEIVPLPVVGGFVPVPNVCGSVLGVPIVDGNGPAVPIIDGDGLGIGTTTNGLTPALPISTEPNGIPVRAAVLGDMDGIAPLDEALLLVLVPQIAALPGNEVPIPTPIPPPSYVLKPDIPDAGLPVAEQLVPAPANPMVPLVAGLIPGVASSVAPMGIPVGETDEPGAIPSGEVPAIAGMGLPIPPTCAKAGLQPNSAARVAAINARRIVISIVLRQGSGRAQRSTGPASLISSFGALSISLTLFSDCCNSVAVEHRQTARRHH